MNNEQMDDSDIPLSCRAEGPESEPTSFFWYRHKQEAEEEKESIDMQGSEHPSKSSGHGCQRGQPVWPSTSSTGNTDGLPGFPLDGSRYPKDTRSVDAFECLPKPREVGGNGNIFPSTRTNGWRKDHIILTLPVSVCGVLIDMDLALADLPDVKVSAGVKHFRSVVTFQQLTFDPNKISPYQIWTGDLRLKPTESKNASVLHAMLIIWALFAVINETCNTQEHHPFLAPLYRLGLYFDGPLAMSEPGEARSWLEANWTCILKVVNRLTMSGDDIACDDFPSWIACLKFMLDTYLGIIWKCCRNSNQVEMVVRQPSIWSNLGISIPTYADWLQSPDGLEAFKMVQMNKKMRSNMLSQATGTNC
jgi:hypothetical protein